MVFGLLGRRQSDERGAIAVLVAISLTVFLLLLAFVIDLGNGRQIRRQAQNAADAASLAAARELEITRDAVTAKVYAAEYVRTNMFYNGGPPVTLSGCPSDIVDGATTCFAIGDVIAAVTTPISLPGRTVPANQAIEVEVCKTVETVIGGVAGVSELEPCAVAVASFSNKPPMPRGIVVLDPEDPASVYKEGGGTLIVHDGDVLVNSSAAGALQCNSAGGMIITDGGQTKVFGTNAGADCIDPDPLLNYPPTPDPLLGLPTPATAGLPLYAGCNGSTTTSLSPGIYLTPCEITGRTRDINMAPGNYIFQGGFKCSGTTKRVIGNGVFFYIGHGDDNGDGTDDGNPYEVVDDPSTTTAYPKFITEGDCQLQITAPLSGLYEQVILFQARCNENESHIAGGGSAIAGTIYIPCGGLRIAGNSNLRVDKAMMVVNKLNVAGSGLYEFTAVEPPQTDGSGGLVLEA